jgi:hypothetical protein
LSLVAGRLAQTIEETRCTGCRTALLSKYCRTCSLVTCAGDRHLSFCNQCPDFPCSEFEAFQTGRPHRLELKRDLALCEELGVREWLRRAEARYSCRSCGTVNSAYDIRCRKCGREPGSAFVAEHGAAILKDMARRLGEDRSIDEQEKEKG